MFRQRSTQKEIMDDLLISSEIQQTLYELDVINRRLGGNRVTLRGLEKLLSPFMGTGKTITIADLGCGGGDILKAVAHWGRKKRLKLKLIGIDANPNIITYAKENTSDYPEVSYQVVNIFSREFSSQKFDVIMCSLFTHHFTDDELITLFSQLKNQYTKGIVINDLHRHPLAYYAIKMLTGIFSRSKMVKNDGPVSVLRSFSRKDWQHIFSKAGIRDYFLKWMWAFRWQVIVGRA